MRRAEQRLSVIEEFELADCLQGDALPIDITRTTSRLKLLRASTTSRRTTPAAR